MSPPRPRALVLAAGRGERLRPLTFELPKPLLPVAGRPLVDWTLERLPTVGCRQAALNLHHLGERIRATFGARAHGVELRYSDESAELLGTGGALVPLAEFLGAASVVLVVNGDSLCRWPLDRLLATHRRRRARATLLVHRGVDPRRFGGGVAVEGGRIVAFRPGRLAWRAARSRRVFAGAAALAPELVDELPHGPSDIVSALYEPLLEAGEPIAAVETSRPWFDLGTPARYLEATLAWGLAGRPAGAAWIAPSAHVAESATVRRAVIEGGATVEVRARITDAVVFPGARIGAGARLERAIVGPGVAVADGAELNAVLWTAGEDPDSPIETPIETLP